MPLKLVTVNIEGDKHFSTIFPFLQHQQPDVICLQEVFEADLELFTKTLGGSISFVTMTMMNEQHGTTVAPRGAWGIAMWFRDGLQYQPPDSFYYRGNEKTALESRHPGHGANRAVLVATITHEGTEFVIATTHFTWTPDGVADERQREDVGTLLGYLERYPELVLCGDFNAPRGGEIFTAFSEHFTDNVPADVKTTLDPKLHYLRDSVHVVLDSIFSSSGFAVHQLEVHEGISDHKAISAVIDLS